MSVGSDFASSPQAQRQSRTSSASNGSKQRSSATGRESATVTYYRSANVWYEDGNIILAAQKIAFKVHRSFLGKHSSVFLGMIETASKRCSSGKGFLLDDCPTVVVKDDPKELAIFLNMLYDPGNECVSSSSCTVHRIGYIKLDVN